MADKSKELFAQVNLVNDKLKFEGIVEGNSPISVDYIPPLGDGQGYTSLELFLISLSTCIGSSVLTFLRKMQKNISSFSIESKGVRKQDHPTCFETIYIDMSIAAENLSNEEVDRVIKLSEETYCPVWAMIKGNVELVVNYKINN